MSRCCPEVRSRNGSRLIAGRWQTSVYGWGSTRNSGEQQVPVDTAIDMEVWVAVRPGHPSMVSQTDTTAGDMARVSDTPIANHGVLVLPHAGKHPTARRRAQPQIQASRPKIPGVCSSPRNIQVLSSPIRKGWFARAKSEDKLTLPNTDRGHFLATDHPYTTWSGVRPVPMEPAGHSRFC